MKLKMVGKICLIMMIIGYISRLAIGYNYILNNPVAHVFANMDTYALIFFFYMLVKNSEE